MTSEVLQFRLDKAEVNKKITAVRVEEFGELSEALKRGAEVAIFRTSEPELKPDGFWGKEVATGRDNFTAYIAFKDKSTASKFGASSIGWVLDSESAAPFTCLKGEGSSLKVAVAELNKVFGQNLDYDDSGMFLFGAKEETPKVRRAAA